ncbi:MAG: hypothetical protein ACI957_000897 [Verrucomicrobiales bacterium]
MCDFILGTSSSRLIQLSELQMERRPGAPCSTTNSRFQVRSEFTGPASIVIANRDGDSFLIPFGIREIIPHFHQPSAAALCRFSWGCAIKAAEGYQSGRRLSKRQRAIIAIRLASQSLLINHSTNPTSHRPCRGRCGCTKWRFQDSDRDGPSRLSSTPRNSLSRWEKVLPPPCPRAHP